MSATTEPEFYDRAMTGEGEPAMLPLEDSPWRPLYEQAAAWIHPSHPVVDLGCGTGRFAECLRRQGHHVYRGIDFSALALAECIDYVPLHDADTEWSASFECCDLREWEPDLAVPTTTTYVCLETLEHLRDDRDLVRRVPAGYEFIFSVPNYGGEAHLRTFQNVSDAWVRYAPLLDFYGWARIGSGRYVVHLYRARRRVDSW